MQEVIPAELLTEEAEARFLAWLRSLLMADEDKKALLMFWVDRVGTRLTGDMVHAAGIERR